MGYLRLDHTVAALQMELYDRFGGDVSCLPQIGEFRIERKGCCGQCVQEFPATINGSTVTVNIPEGVVVNFDRGYYVGRLTIDCEEVCKLDFMVGRDLCVKPTLVKDSERTCLPKAAQCCGDTERTGQDYYRIIEETDEGEITLWHHVVCVDRPEPCEPCHAPTPH